MLTNDDLKKLQSTVREEIGKLEIKIEDTETNVRGVIHKETDILEKKLSKVIREEIDTLETKMEHRFNNMEKQMQQDRKPGHNFSMMLESFLIN